MWGKICCFQHLLPKQEVFLFHNFDDFLIHGLFESVFIGLKFNKWLNVGILQYRAPPLTPAKPQATLPSRLLGDQTSHLLDEVVCCPRDALILSGCVGHLVQVVSSSFYFFSWFSLILLFFRPTRCGSRQVVKQAGKPVAYLQIQRINAEATSLFRHFFFPSPLPFFFSVQRLYGFRQVVTHVQPQQKRLNCKLACKAVNSSAASKRAGNGPIQSPVSNPIKNEPNQKRSKQTNKKTHNHNQNKPN